MLNAFQAGSNFQYMLLGDFQDKPSVDSVMPDFEQEEHVFMSARRMSASSETHHGHPAKES